MSRSSRSDRRDPSGSSSSSSPGRRVRLVSVLIAVVALALPVLSTTISAGSDDLDAAENLAMLRDSTVRNRNHDQSPFRDTPQAALDIADHLGERSDYLTLPGGNPERSYPVEAGGQFRVACEFSHFAYDDPLVAPGRPGAAHLHMFWGNTDTNAHSTYESLRDSGSSTCNGQELNRTAYWAPAMFDADGDVRIPERIVIYYKGYGLARGRSQPYPEGAAMIADDTVHTTSWNEGGTAGPSTGEFSFLCSDQWRGLRRPAAETIPECDGSRFFDQYGSEEPRATLEMHVKFPNCWNGEDPADPDNWGLGRVGGWFYSECEERSTFPNIEYIIQYPIEIGETTDGWFLSSDVDPDTGQLSGEPGETVHADWWGAWHPEVNQQWLDNCTNFAGDQPSGCGFGYLTDGGPDGDAPIDGPALRLRPEYDGPVQVAADVLVEELCPNVRAPHAAYCDPGAGPVDPGEPVTSTTATPTTAVPPTSATPTTTAAPTTIAPTTTAAPTTIAPTTTAPPTTLVGADSTRCGDRLATIVGTAGDDVLVGTGSDDVIHGGGGDDVIFGGRGEDVLCGGPGDDAVLGQGNSDQLFGGDGADLVVGGFGQDHLDGGDGDDLLVGERGRNHHHGGAGDDRCDDGNLRTTFEDCETAGRSPG